MSDCGCWIGIENCDGGGTWTRLFEPKWYVGGDEDNNTPPPPLVPLLLTVWLLNVCVEGLLSS